MPSLVTTDREDPLSRALQPPADETPEQRQDRLRQEKEAKQRSDEIDAQLKQEAKVRSKRKDQLVRVLLLGESNARNDIVMHIHLHVIATGQSESGKSTTLKSERLLYYYFIMAALIRLLRFPNGVRTSGMERRASLLEICCK